MKLDAKVLRYLTRDDFRVLSAAEVGSKNHEVVPTDLIARIASIRGGGEYKILRNLARHSLVAHVGSKHCKCTRVALKHNYHEMLTRRRSYVDDGFRLTYGGYDYLALHTLSQRDVVRAVGQRIGVGKESDIYIVADQDDVQMALKIHRYACPRQTNTNGHVTQNATMS